MTSAMATDDSVSQQPESRDPVVVTADGVMNRGAYQAVLVLFITFAIILNAFIAGIVVRIFVTKPKVWLDNLNDPCVEFFGVTVLNVSADPDKIRALPAVKYLIPALVLVSAHVLLILSDFMRPRSSKPGGANASAGKSTTDEAEVDFSSELSARLGVGVTPHHSQTPSVGTTHNERSARIRKLLQTVDVRLAGLLVFVLYLPEFILMMAYAEDAPEPDPDVTVQHVRLEAASELLKVLLLVLGCFDMSGATDRQGFATHKPSLQDAIPAGIPCPVNCDYQLVAPGVYFRLYMTAQTHAAARAQCQQDGATLYRMKTEERRQLLKDFALSQGIQATDMLWLDGDRTSGAYRWGDGDTLGLTDDSSLWYSGQPDLTGECVKTIGNFRLDDKNCQVPYILFTGYWSTGSNTI
nr:hypothetical protein BaRGS_029387 [Batillaria attramentaria]